MPTKLTRLGLDHILAEIQMAEAGQVPVNWWHSGSSDFGARNDGYGKERVFSMSREKSCIHDLASVMPSFVNRNMHPHAGVARVRPGTQNNARGDSFCRIR
jgi:hypothetical protein